ncbi:MAG: TULIP family P47-like protein, partial [Chloroflexi bacterium]|nr:TULIP family P47-like protein [Chloroflexota bacterium]
MDTYGYDYSFALTRNTVNEILKLNLANVDMSVVYSSTDPKTGLNVTIQAKLAPWSLMPGGSNKLLRFNMPFTSGTLTIDGLGKPPYDLTNAAVEIEANLGWLGSASVGTQGGGDQTKLVFNFQQSTSPDQHGYVSTVEVTNNGHLDDLSIGVLHDVMPDVLIQNQANLQYIFANVNPTPANVSNWLAPKSWDYYYTEREQDQFGVLCFLCMLTDAPLPTTPAFDSSILTTSDDAFLLISQPMFLQHIVLPSVQNSFNGSFSLESDATGWKIVNQSSFNIGNVTANSFVCRPSDSGL